MPEANWACPICKAAHLDFLPGLPEDIVKTHLDEHFGGEGGSTARVQPDAIDSGYWVLRDGNGNRWVNREPFNTKVADFVGSIDPDPDTNPYPEPRITDEAWGLVMGDRQSSYNHPARDFEATGRMWAAILTNWLNLDEPMRDIEPRIVALMLAMVKVSRESHKHKHDNLVDLIGYALCADRVTRDY